MRNCAQNLARQLPVVVFTVAVLLSTADPSFAQRLLGLDVSAHQSDITTTEWATLKRPKDQQVGGVFGDGLDFVIIRSSRGGTTGYDHRQGGYPSSSPDNNNAFTQSERYDDPYFGRNITRATAAGLYAGTYHFARLDVIVGTVNSDGSLVTVANTGTDEANHFMQMAGAWMRPGYLPPMYDLEAGQSQRTPVEIAQFSLDFSNRIYDVMGIRPSIYSNGSYNGTLANGTAAQRDELAQPAANMPSVVSPAYPTLVIARWPNQADPNSIDVQNAHPKDSFTPIYGPWDDYGTTHPWNFWQYSSTMKLNGNNLKASNTDVDVSQGDVEWFKDQLIPAVWMNNTSGDWSTLTNWNSGQPVVAPLGPPTVPSCGTCTTGTGQLAPIGTQTLPTPRLPGAAGSGPAVTSGVNDTIILERPDANVTVTLSAGAHDIRKLYMREALNITGGSLTINYDPNYVSDTINYPNALRSGPISAQFSGPVTISGSGSLSVSSLQVDASQTFTLAGSSGTLAFKQISLGPHATAPAKIVVTGDVNVNPLNNATAKIANGDGAGNTGFIDLNGGAQQFNVGNGAAGVDLDIAVPITNGGLTKTGAGTMRLSANNTLSGAVTVKAGALLVNATNATNNVTVNGGTFGGTGSVSGSVVVNSTGHIAPGASIESLDVGALTLNAGSVLDFELGAPGVSDLINVNGLLSLNGGSLNLTNAGGLAFGTYTLIDYGTVTGSVAALGTPSGPVGYSYSLIDTGSMINLVVTFPGDFNSDGIVDSGDYVVWRKGLGTTYTQADYDVWQAHFGEVAGSGSELGGHAAVPEPAAVVLMLCGVAGIFQGRRGRIQRERSR